MASRKYTHRTEGQWKELVGGHQKSNLSVRAYCKQIGIGDQSFYTWRKRLASTTPAILNEDLVDITSLFPADAKPNMVTRWSIQLDLGGGVKLNLSQI